MTAGKCKICSKSVYPMDPQINLDGSIFHKPCAKCADCGCQITLSNFSKYEAGESITLLCKTHYFKRFREDGSYLGGEKFQVKATRDLQVDEKRQSLNMNTDKRTSTTTTETSAVVASEEAPEAPITITKEVVKPPVAPVEEEIATVSTSDSIPEPSSVVEKESTPTVTETEEPKVEELVEALTVEDSPPAVVDPPIAESSEV